MNKLLDHLVKEAGIPFNGIVEGTSRSGVKVHEGTITQHSGNAGFTNKVASGADHHLSHHVGEAFGAGGLAGKGNPAFVKAAEEVSEGQKTVAKTFLGGYLGGAALGTGAAILAHKGLGGLAKTSLGRKLGVRAGAGFAAHGALMGAEVGGQMSGLMGNAKVQEENSKKMMGQLKSQNKIVKKACEILMKQAAAAPMLGAMATSHNNEPVHDGDYETLSTDAKMRIAEKRDRHMLGGALVGAIAGRVGGKVIFGKPKTGTGLVLGAILGAGKGHELGRQEEFARLAKSDKTGD